MTAFPTPGLVTGELAAAEVDVSPATLRKWVQLGHLRAAGRQGRRLLYRLEDVFAAERSVHRDAIPHH
ncbi:MULTISPECIES: helix-turn-helix domain-containing protein [unclassified Streptomyces]|uniref:helix-turn-helix domain-containing protein n=1 Tax=unclassified Streptomyces TaxID=2593676 RepID=UPI0033D1A74B